MLVLFPESSFHLGEQIVCGSEGWRPKATMFGWRGRSRGSRAKDADAGEKNFRERALRLLITCSGSPAIHGTLQMLRENPDRQEVVCYGVDANPRVFSKNLVDHFFPVPPTDAPDYIPALLEICERQEIDLILFHSDYDVLACAGVCDAFEKIGTRLVCADLDVLERAANKGELYTALAESDIAIPEHRLVTRETCVEAAHALGYPNTDLIAKPCMSVGAKGVYRITEKPLPWDRRLRLPMATLSQLKVSLDRPILLTEHLPGDEYSVDAFIGARARVAIPRKRDTVVGGVAIQTTLVYRPDLAEAALQAGKLLGLTSLYGMQFRCDAAGEPKLLECNPRIQGSLVASIYSGVNLIWMAVQEALGVASHTPLATPLHGITFARNWVGGVVGLTD